MEHTQRGNYMLIMKCIFCRFFVDAQASQEKKINNFKKKKIVDESIPVTDIQTKRQQTRQLEKNKLEK